MLIGLGSQAAPRHFLVLLLLGLEAREAKRVKMSFHLRLDLMENTHFLGLLVHASVVGSSSLLTTLLTPYSL
jgi:hypothetical protein